MQQMARKPQQTLEMGAGRRGKRKSSDPTPPHSNLIQQQPQPYICSMPRFHPEPSSTTARASIRAPNLQQNVSGQRPLHLVPFQTRNYSTFPHCVPQQYFSSSLSLLQFPPPPVLDFVGANHGYYCRDLIPPHYVSMPYQNFHPQQQYYMSTFARHETPIIQQSSTYENTRDEGNS